MQTNIHPTALVEKGAQLGVGVSVGPYCVVGAKAVLHDGVELMSHVVVAGRSTLGARTKVWPFASIGTTPQDLKFKGEDTELVCGTDNMIREYVNLSIGTEGGGGRTVVGSGNLFMVNTHVAHDCIVGNRCIFANGVSLAGHVTVADGAVLGGHSAVHQFVRIGALAMLAGGAIVVQDVPPYCMVAGNHATLNGLNLVGLRRAPFPKERLGELKAAFKIAFRSSKLLQEAVEEIKATVEPSPERDIFVDFLLHSERGICR